MHRRLAWALTVMLLCTVVAGVLLVDFPGEREGDTVDSDHPENRAVLAQFDDVDRTVFEITVSESGDARWAVESRTQIPFDDTEQREQFDEFAQQFVTEETETFEDFKLRAQRLVDSGVDATNREMGATEFQRDAFYDEATQQGVVRMSFRWEGFAQVSDDSNGRSVTVSDVFGGGFAILEDQQLRIHRDDTLVFDSESIDPSPDRLELADNVTGSDWIRWDGPKEFDSDRPRVTFVNASAAAAETGQQPAENDADETDETENGEDNTGMMISLLVAMVVLVVVGGVAIWYASSRPEPETGQSTGAPTEPTGGAEPKPEQQLREEELLSDEDRVVKLLEENGGRMRQVAIVDETDWSKSKVSMLLSDMEEEGDISKLRVGRENIISLAGQEPEAAGSPFENEGE